MKKFSIVLVGISLFTGITQAQAQPPTATSGGGIYAGGTQSSQYYTGGGYIAPTPGTVSSIYSSPGVAYPAGSATNLTRDQILAQQRAALEAQKIDLVTQALQQRDQIISDTHGAMTAAQTTQDNAVRTSYEAQKAALEEAYKLKYATGGATPGTAISTP